VFLTGRLRFLNSRAFCLLLSFPFSESLLRLNHPLFVTKLTPSPPPSPTGHGVLLPDMPLYDRDFSRNDFLLLLIEHELLKTCCLHDLPYRWPLDRSLHVFLPGSMIFSRVFPPPAFHILGARFKVVPDVGTASHGKLPTRLSRAVPSHARSQHLASRHIFFGGPTPFPLPPPPGVSQPIPSTTATLFFPSL